MEVIFNFFSSVIKKCIMIGFKSPKLGCWGEGEQDDLNQ